MKQVNMKKDEIKTILTTILSDLNDLYTLLNTEKDLLSKSDFEYITTIADQKKQLITDIELNDTKFKTALSNENYAQTENSIQDFIIKASPDSASLWTEIENLLKICKDKNSINGIILTNNRRQIQNRLAILQGQANEVLTYGATGESVVASSNSNTPISV